MLCIGGGGGGNVELGGSGTSRNATLANDEEGVSSGAEFDDDAQDTDEIDGDDVGLQEHVKLARDYALEGLYDTSIIFFDGVVAQINRLMSFPFSL
ncbi:unnamed protein product [Vicia faba]|uniref:Katanin p60 ATPase-containing subunit A1 MIT domain-containing protein n=1 Tax=Vicia faba TaxID=3906 RepID=A0AAV1B9L3_VICFA|nr:unnamed protein product [Vicia faba]